MCVCVCVCKDVNGKVYARVRVYMSRVLCEYIFVSVICTSKKYHRNELPFCFSSKVSSLLAAKLTTISSSVLRPSIQNNRVYTLSLWKTVFPEQCCSRNGRIRIVSTFCACRILRAHSVHMFCVYICVYVSMYIVYSISIAAEKLPSNFAAKRKRNREETRTRFRELPLWDTRQLPTFFLNF